MWFEQVILTLIIIIIFYEPYTSKYNSMIFCVKKKKSSSGRYGTCLSICLHVFYLLLYVDDFNWTFGVLQQYDQWVRNIYLSNHAPVMVLKIKIKKFRKYFPILYLI